ncbi:MULTISPECIES: CoA-transferase subunit beta [Micromonospora]|uniref:CoA-transferase subunit beta n=1 Tax=Micromonospora TaxID=1873 RepID=UPI0021C76946|nr:CoA-transferase [Micromonospora sp. Mcm103]
MSSAATESVDQPTGSATTADAPVTRAEYCAVAVADTFAGDGESIASAFGTIPAIGVRLARLTVAPDLLLTDGEAHFVSGSWAIGADPHATEGVVIEGWSPFRTIFDLVWHGKRHVMMIPVQIDGHGNTNISAIGDYARPKVQLLGVRGAPGNSVYHPTSYWVPNHSTRSFVRTVDMVSGVGTDSARAAGPAASAHHDLRRVVTNLAVLDFGGPDGTMRLLSLHPGVTIEEFHAATGCAVHVEGEVPATREPSAEELRLIREVIDPRSLRDREIPA